VRFRPGRCCLAWTSPVRFRCGRRAG